MPRLRPTRPMALNRSRNSGGEAVSSSPNSSTTMSSQGNGSSRGSVARRAGVGTQVGLVAGQVQEPLAPGQLALEGGQGPVDHRQVGLQVGDEARDLRERGPGRRRRRRLKSTSTKASWSGGWVAARPATTVRSSSLLPEPVAPTTSLVRPDAVLGRLLEIQQDRIPTHGDADRHPEQLGSRTRSHP